MKEINQTLGPIDYAPAAHKHILSRGLDVFKSHTTRSCEIIILT